MKSITNLPQRWQQAALILWILVECFAANAQKSIVKSENLHLVARRQPDSVILRWGVTRPDLWRQGQQFGYYLDKATLKKGKPNYSLIAHVKPASKTELTAAYQANKDNQAVGIALATLYGNQGQRQTETFSQLQSGAASLNMSFGYNLLMSDIMPDVAQLSGLRFTDRAPAKGETILYRLRLGGAKSTTDTCYLMIVGGESDTLPPCPVPEIISEEKQVKLRWTFPIGSFVAFHVEKSKAGKAEYFRLNQYPIQFSDERQTGPLFQAEYRDTGLINYEPWDYRLIGITSFGENIPILQPVTGMGKDLTPVSAPALEKPIHLPGGAQKLSWNWNGKEKDLAGFQLTKSLLAEGPYQPIGPRLPATSRSYTDTSPAPVTGCYYLLTALDTAGNSAPSLPVLAYALDSIAPEVPGWLEGIADTSGYVRLRWKSCSATDWKSFKLYRAYQRDHVFQLITPAGLIDTTYTDTIVARSLTGKVYYRLTTQDLSANNSNLGAILEVKRPDLIPPVSPIITGIRREKQQTMLTYRPSQSKDVAETWAEWRLEKQSNWNRFQLANSRRLEDTAIMNFIPAGSLVEVRLVAIDSAGLSSPPSAWASIKIPFNPEQLIGNWQIKADTTAKALIINWEKPFEGEIQVLIAESSRSLQTQKSAEGQQQKTVITGLKPGNQYRIALRLVSPTGEWITETRTATLTEP